MKFKHLNIIKLVTIFSTSVMRTNKEALTPVFILSLAICTGMDNTAAAQDTAPLIEEIKVVGQRLANQRAIEVKRRSGRVLDAVSDDDIGALPDFNIGEAVQRLPGITISNDQAEARFIAIRSLNPAYNYMTVDGSSVAVPDRNGRRPYMDTLPASLAGRIEVIKTLTPDLEGSAVGGHINLVSRNPFDFEERFLKVGGEVGLYENDEGFNGDSGPSGTADIIFADTFGAQGQYGLLLTGNYYRRDSYIPQVEYGSDRYWYNPDGSRAQPYGGLGNNYEVPRERRWYWYHNERQRYGFSGQFRYRHSDSQEYWIRSFWNTATDDEMRQTDLIQFGGSGTVSQQANPDGAVSGAVTGARHQLYLGQFDFERTVWAVQLGADYDFADDHNLTTVINITGSKFDNPEYWHEWRQGNVGFSYMKLQNGDYAFNPTDRARYDDPAQYNATRQSALDDRGLNEDIYELQVDYGFNNDGDAEGWGYKTGIKYRSTDRVFNEDGDRYVPVAGNDYTLAVAGVLVDMELCPPGCSGGDTLFILDPDRVFSSFEGHLAANPAQWRLDGQETNDNRRDYNLDENVLAGYGMITHAAAKHRLIFGVRYERTDWSGTGRVRTNGVWGATSNEGDYDNILPSVNFIYDLTDDIKIHTAYSHAIGRAPFNNLAPVGESITESNGIVTVDRSNPELRPRKSKNADVSVEWYFDGGQGLLSLGLFYKKLQDEIISTEAPITIIYEGQQVEALVNQDINAGDDIEIKGLELNLVKDLSFLPRPLNNLGIFANATWIDTDFQIATPETSAVSGYFHEQNLLVGQADKVYNATLFYEDGRFSARLAYNKTGLKLSERVNFSRPYRSRYDTPKEKIDLQASYKFNESWEISFNAWNLTGEGRGEVLGRDQELKIVEADFGRAYFLGLVYNR